MRLSLLQYNVHLFDGTVAWLGVGHEDRARRDALAEVLKREQPDVVFLQEVWSDESIAAIARNSGMPYRASDGCRAWFPKVSGLLILSRYPVTYPTFEPFTTLVGDDRLSAKGVLACTIEVEGKRLLAVAAHTQSRNSDAARMARADNLMQAVRVLSRRRSGHHAVVFAGDLNTPSDARGVIHDKGFLRAMDLLGMVDLYRAVHPDNALAPGCTYLPGRNALVQRLLPRYADSAADARLDYMFGSGVTPIRAEVATDRVRYVGRRSTAPADLSDHEPLWVEIELAPDTR